LNLLLLLLRISAVDESAKNASASVTRRIPNRQGNRQVNFLINTVTLLFIFIRLGLSKCEDTAAYDLTIDLDIHAIGTYSKCARPQIVDVLAAIDSEV
jgi:hypothetical protein